ncbi:MAG TPA: enoyl-CoA hydratase/isomerase family protein [Pseudonocardiaceae bacterium]|nr:enoyl-CoA hydratase/isomerase family protein [Pseudonocardiaceae bacterium]
MSGCGMSLVRAPGTCSPPGSTSSGYMEGGADYARHLPLLLGKALEAVFECPLRVVAAVNGHAIGGGCVLACCVDVRVMADGDGEIGLPELRVGVPFPRHPSDEPPQTLARMKDAAGRLAGYSLVIVDEMTTGSLPRSAHVAVPVRRSCISATPALRYRASASYSARALRLASSRSHRSSYGSVSAGYRPSCVSRMLIRGSVETTGDSVRTQGSPPK